MPVEMLKAVGENQVSFANPLQLAATAAGAIIAFVYAVALPPGVLYAFVDIFLIEPIDRIFNRLVISFTTGQFANWIESNVSEKLDRYVVVYCYYDNGQTRAMFYLFLYSDDIKIVRTVGQGSFGAVYEGVIDDDSSKSGL